MSTDSLSSDEGNVYRAPGVDVNAMTMLDAALAYAQLDIPVFPLHGVVFDDQGNYLRCDCAKGAQCPDPGKHPWTLHGLKSATTDPAIIRRWWAIHPDANIALRTDRLPALDSDADMAGLQEARQYGVDITAVHTRTGRGNHYPFRAPAGVVLPNRTKSTGSWPLTLCDARGRGGYIVAPPSWHRSGRRYQWQQGGRSVPFDFDALPEVPPELLAVWAPDDGDPRRDEAFHDEAAGEGEGEGEGEGPEETPPPDDGEDYVDALMTPAVYFLDRYLGEVRDGAGRNDTGFRYALQLRDAGLTRDEATPWMRRYQQGCPEDPAKTPPKYLWSEAEASLRSAYARGKRAPAQAAKDKKKDAEVPAVQRALTALEPIFAHGEESAGDEDRAEHAVAERFHDEAGRAYATVPMPRGRPRPGEEPVIDHHETLPLDSRRFKRWLRFMAFLRGQTLGHDQLATIVELWAAQAEFLGRECEVAHRLYQEDDQTVWLDLGDETQRAVKVTAQGWEVVYDPPVKFIRKEGSYALPTPIKDTARTPRQVLDEVLRPYTNIRRPEKDEVDRDWVLFCCFLIASLRPRGPFPILQLTGEKGVAKSTLGRVVRKLLDPHKVELEPQPGELRDMSIAAQGSWLLAYDNLTALTDRMSNALCRMSTGGGFRTRTLYTDEGETLFSFMRPVLLTGLTGVVKRDDLIDRTLTVGLPYLPREARKTEQKFWAAFDRDHAVILGALLDLLAATLAALPEVSEVDLPRMADFARVSRAIEAAMGWEKKTFDTALTETGSEAAQELLEDSVIAGPVLRFVDERRKEVDAKKQQQQEKRKLVWEGTLQDLLAELLRQLRAIHSLETEPEKRFRDWPKTPQALNARAVELQGALRGRGIEVVRGKRTGASRWWHVYDSRDVETATLSYEETHREVTSMPWGM